MLSAAILCGCAVGPDYVRPEITQGADYSRDPLPAATASADVPGGASQPLVAGMDIPGLWWSLFQSPALNELVDEAMRANPDVAAAQASLHKANELVYADRASLFPTVGASLSSTREKSAFGGFPPQLLTVHTAVLGVAPLVWATGAGAAGRHDMGLVIFAGLSIGTLLTLFVVPAMYMFVGSTHTREVAEKAPRAEATEALSNW